MLKGLVDIFYSAQHKLHDIENVVVNGAPLGSEEVSARAELILQALQQANLGKVRTPDDHGIMPILAAHDAAYVDFLQRAYDDYAAYYHKAEPVTAGTFAPPGFRRRTKHIYGELGLYAYGDGSPILAGTWQAAYWSVQCALSAVDAVLHQGEMAYALCRPPGHHATADHYGGFCYLNNVAIAARYWQQQRLHGRRRPRLAILDIDYHHGNGTQEIFYRDGAVLYCSLHAHPDDDYPFYWGEANERGAGRGAGCNRNWPLPQGTGDAAYLAALKEALESIAAFKPRGLLVSLGLDTFRGDPVGGFNLSTDGLAAAGQAIGQLKLPCAVVQEGGYLLEKLGENCVAFLKGLMTANDVYNISDTLFSLAYVLQ